MKKTVKQEVISRASALGVNIDDSMNDEIKCEAPHRKIWSCSFIHELVCAKDSKEPKSVIWKDLLERMSYGLEDCTDDNCEWCNGI